MIYFMALLSLVALSQETRFMPRLEDHSGYYPRDTNILLQDIINQMGNELAEADNSFADDQDGSRVSNEYDNVKEIPVPLDYMGNLNPNPSIRDQEYLRHSSLWSYQRLNDENMKHKIQQGGFKGVANEKMDTNLPAYCTPPNPCPIGFTTDDHCLVDFENTADFSRDYQNSQDCMCDIEHMVDCTNRPDWEDTSNLQIDNSDFGRIVERFQEKNPFLTGEKLPIAAKKGINVMY